MHCLCQGVYYYAVSLSEGILGVRRDGMKPLTHIVKNVSNGYRFIFTLMSTWDILISLH